MKPDRSADELVAHWTLLPNELALLGNKTGATRLGFAVLLKFFQADGCFPSHPQEISVTAVDYVALQAGVPASECHSAGVRPSAKSMLPLPMASFIAVGLSNRWNTSVLIPGLPPQ